jgi:hypothetical protein
VGLAEQYYADPWQWPLIWEMNPQVTDPHWIYPGQMLKIKMEQGVTVYGEVKQKIAEDLFEPANIPVFDTTFSYDTRVNQIDLISETSLEGAGQIVDHIDDQLMLGENHEVYFTMRKDANVQLGDVFTVFRVEKKIEHPIKKDKVGYLINLLGEVQTINSSTLPNGKIVFTGRIIDATSEITATDRLMPMNREPIRIKLKLTDLELTGTIIQASHDDELALGTDKTAFIDLGVKHGLKVGNSLSVWRHSKDPKNLPGYKIGHVIVTRVGDKTATVLITHALRPIQVGDTVISDVQ